MLNDLLNGCCSQRDFLNYHNANLTYIELPKYIHGFVFYYKGIYNVIINKNLSQYMRKKALVHELAHIELNQLLQCDKDLFAFHIQQYEDEADKYVKFLLESAGDFDG